MTRDLVDDVLDLAGEELVAAHRRQVAELRAEEAALLTSDSSSDRFPDLVEAREPEPDDRELELLISAQYAGPCTPRRDRTRTQVLEKRRTLSTE